MPFTVNTFYTVNAICFISLAPALEFWNGGSFATPRNFILASGF